MLGRNVDLKLSVVLAATLSAFGCTAESVQSDSDTVASAVEALSPQPIELPIGKIVRFDYAGQELYNDVNANGVIDAGDWFTGVLNVSKIVSADGTEDLSKQLDTKELTVHFRFSVIGGSSNIGHIEFGVLPGDFIRMYVGFGATKNFDPSKPDAFARASDGELWLEIAEPVFFESVNDFTLAPIPINRAWSDLSKNETGYKFAKALFRTLVDTGFPPEHTYQGEERGDLESQLIFTDYVAGFSPYFPAFTFDLFGDFYLLPEDVD